MRATESGRWIERRRRASGFTLMETIAVLLLVGVLSAIAVVQVGDIVRRSRVRATADILIQNLVYARSKAMATPDNVWVFNYLASPAVLMRNGAAVPLPVSTLTPTDVTVAGGNGSVTFNTFGAPDSQKVITVSGGSFSQTITVWAETGLIE